GLPASPATVEKRARTSVRAPLRNRAARVYWDTSSVVSNTPKAPPPFAGGWRSGTFSRLKCAICSRKCTSCRRIGPSGPRVSECRSLAAGVPVPVVDEPVSPLGGLEESVGLDMRRPPVRCRLDRQGDVGARIRRPGRLATTSGPEGGHAMLRTLGAVGVATLLAACSGGGANEPGPGVAGPVAPAPAPAPSPSPSPSPSPAPPPAPSPAGEVRFELQRIAQFDEPWAMTFLPDGRLLVTEKAGTLRLFDPVQGSRHVVAGVPDVVYGGQGGLGDVVLHPGFADNRLVYISYAEAGAGGAGAAVARARLELDAGGGRLEGLEVIWRQVPKLGGSGHFGHRIVFDREGMLWISSSERQAFDPAQDMGSNLGKIVRLHDDGRVPDDNPFAAQGGVAAQVWSLGHRNILGMAFDADGRLWAHEMGPRGGDELNLVERGANYGYPVVSEGDHYDGT